MSGEGIQPQMISYQCVQPVEATPHITRAQTQIHGLTQVLEQKRTLRTGRSDFIVDQILHFMSPHRVPQRPHFAFKDRVGYGEAVPPEDVEVPAPQWR
jgi:hypothetical protein